MKRMSDFDSLEDFGYEARVNELGKVEFIQCNQDLESLDPTDTSIVYSNGDITPGKFFSLETILSGGAINVNILDGGKKDQADLALDYGVATSLAFLGSVYSTVMIGVNKIKDGYPNGIQILDGITGTNTMLFNNSAWLRLFPSSTAKPRLWWKYSSASVTSPLCQHTPPNPLRGATMS